MHDADGRVVAPTKEAADGHRQDVPVWPVLRQLTGTDPLGRGAAARSPPDRGAHRPHRRPPTASPAASAPTAPSAAARRSSSRTRRSSRSRATPTAPSPAGRLCPKGSASKNLVTSPLRQTKVRYRAPYGTEWEDLDLGTAMEMIADRVVKARNDTWQDIDEQDRGVRRTLGIASLGRGDPRQRGELPHQEAVHGDGRHPDREPGAYLTLRHRPRSGDPLRARRRHRVPAGPRQR